MVAPSPVRVQDQRPTVPRHQNPVKCKRSLPSTAIDKTQLVPAEEVLARNGQFVGKEGKLTTLAIVLARESFFGDDVLKICTPKGHVDKPALPHQELMELKEVLRGAYPQFWSAPHLFESQWVTCKCLDSIGQACKRVRNQKKRLKAADFTDFLYYTQLHM